MTTTDTPTATRADKEAAYAVWARYCEALRLAGEDLLLRDDFPVDQLDLAEGLRYLSRLTFGGIERHVEGADPDAPHLYALCDERVKVGGENPDNRYFAAAVDPRNDYELEGDLSGCDYFSVIAVGRIIGDAGEDVGQAPPSITGAITQDELVAGPDGRTTIRLGREATGPNAVRLAEGATSILVRCTIERPTGRPLDLAFRRVGGAVTPPPLELATISDRLGEAARFVGQASSFFASWTAEQQADLNTLPLGNQPYIQSVGGDPNIQYYLSTWAVGPDEALVLHIPRIPPATTWNVQICNVWMESLDYVHSQIHVNSQTATYDDDGGVTVAIAERDPGRPNWLRTLGHRSGSTVLRLVGADEPLVVEAEVVQL